MKLFYIGNHISCVRVIFAIQTMFWLLMFFSVYFNWVFVHFFCRSTVYWLNTDIPKQIQIWTQQRLLPIEKYLVLFYNHQCNRFTVSFFVNQIDLTTFEYQFIIILTSNLGNFFVRLTIQQFFLPIFLTMKWLYIENNVNVVHFISIKQKPSLFFSNRKSETSKESWSRRRRNVH